ncbi:unnamed protein product, partial [Cuscuta campestris]
PIARRRKPELFLPPSPPSPSPASPLLVAVQLEPIAAPRRRPIGAASCRSSPSNWSSQPPASPLVAAAELQRRRCFLRLQPPSLTAVSQRRSLIAAADLQRRHAKRRTSPNAGRRCFALAGIESRRRPSFQPPSPFAQRPPATVECSAASRCSSPLSCRSATVAGVRHRRRIQPLPRVDISGQLVYCVEHRNWPSLGRLQGLVSEVKTCARGSAILGLRPSPEGSYLHQIEAIFSITD